MGRRYARTTCESIIIGTGTSRLNMFSVLQTARSVRGFCTIRNWKVLRTQKGYGYPSTRSICSINEHFFKEWTPKTAYWLGFFHAECNMYFESRSKMLHARVTCQCKNKAHISKLTKAINSTYSMTLHDRFPKESNHRCTLVHSITNQQFNDSLVKLGCVPNKIEKAFVPPNIPRECKNHFVRGYGTFLQRRKRQLAKNEGLFHSNSL